MDMEANGVVQSQVNSEPQSSGNEPVPARTQEERVFRQNEVNEIVKRAKYEAVEGYKRINAEQPQYAQQKYGEQQAAPHSNAGSEAEIRRLAAEEAQRLRDSWVADAQSKYEQEAAQRIVNNYASKIATGKDKYEDFDSVTGNLSMQRYPNVVQVLAEVVDNADDVLYELGKNRSKLVQFERDMRDFPEDTIYEMKRFAESIKQNQQYKNVKSPSQPMSQLRPSNVGADSGVLTVSDLRKKYRV
jgi:hypothetical protein